MIRVLESILVDADDNIRYQRMAGTSGDTKPTAGVANGSLFEEADTGKTYIYNEDSAEWTEYAGGGGGGGGGITIHICSQEEVSQGLPNIQNPDEKTIYLVPTGETGGNLYNEYIWVNGAWEPFGSGEIDLSGYATVANPVFTGSVSLGRKANTTVGTGSTALGDKVTASGDYSHAEGDSTTASGAYSHAEGDSTTASGAYSHAEGGSSTASGVLSHAEGAGTIASGVQSHAEGVGTTASGSQSHAEGASTTASEMQSHAEGAGTIASQYQSHAEGASTTASGWQSHAEGSGTTASGVQSHAEGNQTKAIGRCEHVSGAWNVVDSAPTWTASTSYAVGDKVKRTETFTDGGGISRSRDVIYKCKTANSDSTFTSSKWEESGQWLEVIGNGTADNARSNARTLDWDGNERLKGDLYVGCNSDSTGGTKVIPMPAAPVSDGTYYLSVTVSSGTATYSWVSIPAANGVSF